LKGKKPHFFLKKCGYVTITSGTLMSNDEIKKKTSIKKTSEKKLGSTQVHLANP
jgi:hypothetical protein